jgi:transposase InsO family protein
VGRAAFVEDQTAAGRKRKLWPLVAADTQACWTLQGERSLTAQDVVATLPYGFALRGVPAAVRSDHGPEVLAAAVISWLKVFGAETCALEPGRPGENASSAAFKSRLRDEFLDRELLARLAEAKVLVEDDRLEDNHHRPHRALG